MNRPTYVMRRFLAVRPSRTIRCFTTRSRQLQSQKDDDLSQLLEKFWATSQDEPESFGQWADNFEDGGYVREQEDFNLWEKSAQPDQSMAPEIDAAKNVDPFAFDVNQNEPKDSDQRPLDGTVAWSPMTDSKPILPKNKDLKRGLPEFNIRFSTPFENNYERDLSSLDTRAQPDHLSPSFFAVSHVQSSVTAPLHNSFSPASSSNQPTEPSSSRSSSVPSAPFPSARQRAALPLSPLMAPNQSFWSTLHEPKAPPPENLTPFQKKLMRNPYARALSSPVRMCALTRTWLPRSFLQSFELLPRPDTDELWYLPRDLTAPVSRDQLSPGETNKQFLVGKRHYVLARKELLEAINTRSSGFTGQWQRFPDYQQRALDVFSITRLKWRDDMDSFVLDLMRKRTVEKLVALAGKKAGYLSYATDWEHVAKKKQMAAVLWLGKYTKKARTKFPDWWVDKGKDNSSVENSEGTQEAQDDVPAQSLVDENGPGFFATLSNPPFRNKQLPVHNLIELLGQEGVDSLRAQTPGITNYEFVGVKDKKDTLKIQLMLWKLQGFLAKANDIEEYQESA